MNNVDNNFADSPYITYKLENSLVVAIFKKDVKIDLEIAKQIVHQRLSFQNGNDYLNLADARQIKAATKEARDYLAKHDKGLIAAAILGENSVSNMIINMFLTFSKPRIPTRAFQDKENALTWLGQFSAAPNSEPIPLYEFCKLDSIDFKVASWLFSSSPRLLHSYLEFITKNEYKRKGIKLNYQKVYDELIEVRKPNFNWSLRTKNIKTKYRKNYSILFPMNDVNPNFSDSNYVTFKIENDILIGTYKKNAKIDLEGAEQIVHQRLSFQNGNDYLTLADARHVKSATKEARDYLAKHDQGLIASAILGDGHISNMIINMFITFSKPRIPVKAFQNKEHALKWLSQFTVPVHEHLK